MYLNDNYNSGENPSIQKIAALIIKEKSHYMPTTSGGSIYNDDGSIKREIIIVLKNIASISTTINKTDYKNNLQLFISDLDILITLFFVELFNFDMDDSVLPMYFKASEPLILLFYRFLEIEKAKLTFELSRFNRSIFNTISQKCLETIKYIENYNLCYCSFAEEKKIIEQMQILKHIDEQEKKAVINRLNKEFNDTNPQENHLNIIKSPKNPLPKKTKSTKPKKKINQILNKLRNTNKNK